MREGWWGARAITPGSALTGTPERICSTTAGNVWSAASSGTFLGKDDLPASKTPAVGDTLTITSGNISMSLT